jgi:hypothetical protein
MNLGEIFPMNQLREHINVCPAKRKEDTTVTFARYKDSYKGLVINYRRGGGLVEMKNLILMK